MQYTMMKERKYSILYILIAVLCCTAPKLKAENVTIDALMDSAQIFIGQQTQIRLRICADAGQQIVFPLLKDTLALGVELIDRPTCDTVFLNDGKRLEVTQTYTITSFDSALYYIPPFRVLVAQKEYVSKALALKVHSFPVDEAHPENFFGLRDVMRPPFVWEDWSTVIWMAVLMLPLTLLVGYLMVRFKDNKPIIRREKQAPKLPAHQVALEQIERIKLEKPWEMDQEKEYYTRLTDTLRTYIKERFGFNATEMTSDEIITHLMSVPESIEVFNELKSLFNTADLVKFAKWKPQMNENDYNLLCAVEFVNETKQTVVETAPEVPVEVIIAENRSKREKFFLFFSITVLLALIIYLIFFVFTEFAKLLV